MIVGCYSVDLYCDTGGDVFGGECPYRGYSGSQGEFTGQTEAECLRIARKIGWKFKEGNTLAFCPQCNSKKGKK